MPAQRPRSWRSILECATRARAVINLSLALAQPPSREQVLEEALNQALRRGVLIIARRATRAPGSSAITRHPWVIPVVPAICVPADTRIEPEAVRSHACLTRLATLPAWAPGQLLTLCTSVLYVCNRHHACCGRNFPRQPRPIKLAATKPSAARRASVVRLCWMRR